MMFGKRILTIALVLLFALSLSTTSALAQDDGPGKAGLAAPLIEWLKSLRDDFHALQSVHRPFLLPFIDPVQSAGESTNTALSDVNRATAQLHNELSATVRNGQNAARNGWYIEHQTAVQWAEQIWERIQQLFSAKDASSASLKGAREITVF